MTSLNFRVQSAPYTNLASLIQLIYQKSYNLCVYPVMLKTSVLMRLFWLSAKHYTGKIKIIQKFQK